MQTQTNTNKQPSEAYEITHTSGRVIFVGIERVDERWCGALGARAAGGAVVTLAADESDDVHDLRRRLAGLALTLLADPIFWRRDNRIHGSLRRMGYDA